MTHTFAENYDVIVIGDRACWCRSGLGTSRMGCKTLLGRLTWIWWRLCL